MAVQASNYRVAKSTRASTIALWGMGLVVVALAVAPVFVTRSTLQDLFFLLTIISLAQCWNLLAGYAGLVSIGQQAFVGLGAYAGYGLAILAGVNPMLAIVLAGVVGAVLAVPTAFVVFRLQGAYFAIGTWVAAEVYRLLFAQWKALGGGTGTSLPSDVARSIYGLEWVAELFDIRSSAARDIVAYWMALVLVVLVIGAIYVFLRTRNGLALSAIRDNPNAAASVGVDTQRIKVIVYIFAATGAALTGGDAPLRCALEIDEKAGMIAARAVVEARTSVAGRFDLALERRNAAGIVDLGQAGDFSLRRGERAVLNDVAISGRARDLHARFTVTTGGRVLDCPISVNGIVIEET